MNDEAASSDGDNASLAPRVSIDANLRPSDNCYRCGYDLRGITNDRPCPECGLLAERSRRVTDELHDTRPRWLRSLARGVWLMLLSLVLLFASPMAIDAAHDSIMQIAARSGPPFAYWRIEALITWVGLLVPACIFTLGVLSLTARENYAPADQTDQKRRIWLRILALIPLLGVTMEGLLFCLDDSPIGQNRLHGLNFRFSLDTFVLPLLVLLACIPLPALLFYQLRSLAKRARSAHLTEHCAIVGIGTSAALIYASAMVCLLHFSTQLGLDPNWETRSIIALVVMLICTLSASLLALWSFYLLVRFAIAFHSAARKLNRKWKADDHAEISL